jgi:hypothetical protein
MWFLVEIRFNHGHLLNLGSQTELRPANMASDYRQRNSDLSVGVRIQLNWISTGVGSYDP